VIQKHSIIPAIVSFISSFRFCISWELCNNLHSLLPPHLHIVNSESMAQPKSTISIPDVIKKGKKGFQPPPVPDDPTSVEAEVAHNRSQFAMNELTYKWPT